MWWKSKPQRQCWQPSLFEPSVDLDTAHSVRVHMWCNDKFICINYMHANFRRTVLLVKCFKNRPKLLFSAQVVICVWINKMILFKSKCLPDIYSLVWSVSALQVHCGRCFTMYLFCPLTLSGCIIKLRWSVFSCCSWPQLQSGWKLRTQMLTYSLILSTYEREVVGVVWNFTA